MGVTPSSQISKALHKVSAAYFRTKLFHWNYLCIMQAKKIYNFFSFSSAPSLSRPVDLVVAKAGIINIRLRCNECQNHPVSENQRKYIFSQIISTEGILPLLNRALVGSRSSCWTDSIIMMMCWFNVQYGMSNQP